MTDESRREAAVWLERFEAALRMRDAGSVATLFVEGGYWRDVVSFTWNILTLEGRDAIARMLARVSASTLSPIKRPLLS